MMRTLINESALRELLREAMENHGAMGSEEDMPVVVNPSCDRATLELDMDAIEVRHLPRNRGEMIIMVRNLLDGVPDEQSRELYSKIKELVGGIQPGEKDFGHAEHVGIEDLTSLSKEQDMSKQFSENKNLISVIKQIVEEELGNKRMTISGAMVDDEDPDTKAPEDEDLFFKDMGDESGPFSDEEDETASAWDPEEVADSDEDEDDDEQPKGRSHRAAEAGMGYGDVGGVTFDKIAQEFDFTKEAAKKAVETAMERFKVLHSMDPDDRDELVLGGVSDYIDMLAGSGEMTDDDEAFMRAHPRVVANSETFRDFFQKYVKKAAREARADAQAEEDM